MNYRPEIDGLRAMAILPVVFFHLGWPLFNGGYIGVDIFFVISGYLISTLIIKEIDSKKFSILKFYERRIRRIFPALFLVTVVTMLIGWFLMLPSDFKALSQSVFSVSIFSSNIFFWLTNPYFSPPADLQPLLHTWSLSVEEQFYLLYPALVLLCLRLGFIFFVVCLCTIFFSSFLSQYLVIFEQASWQFYLIISRAWELIFGVLIAILLYKAKPNFSNTLKEIGSIIGFVILSSSFLIFDENTHHPSIWTFLPVFGTGLIIVFCTKETALYKILSLKPIVSIGLISYSLYLWHFPIISFTKYSQLQELSFYQSIFIFIFSLVISYISWRFFEKKFRDFKIISTKVVFIFATVGSIFLASIGLVGHFNNGFDNRLSSEQSKLLNIKSLKKFNKQLRTGICFLEDGQSVDGFNKNCSSGEILLWGDSHAAALFEGLNKISAVSQFTSSGCPAIFNIVLADNRNCGKLNNEIFSKIKSNKYEYIILHANWIRHGYGNYEIYLKNTLKKIGNNWKEANIIIIGSTPQWFNSLPKYIVLNDLSINEIAKNGGYVKTDLDELLVADKLIKKIVQELNMENIKFFPVLDRYCKDSKCLGIDPNSANNLLFWDYGHLTERGSSIYVGEVLK
ncbi:MAG: hypothetical protein CMC86_03840 [Flavobacteriaceae bacterium]|nr:hypothetical protein [Flavobacteriaceae bacterium]